jgi:pimeloyl-ACP methyl ester carboxylesterase
MVGVQVFGGRSADMVVVWLPGRAGNFDAVLNGYPEDDPRAVLAAAGPSVYAIDYRTHFVDPTDPEQVTACGRWTIGVFLADVMAVLRLVRECNPGRPIVLAGHSMGGRFAYLCAARLPAGYLAGLVVLDGWVRAPTVTGTDRESLCAAIHDWQERGDIGRQPPSRSNERTARLRAWFMGQAAREPGYAGRMIGRDADADTADLVVRCLLNGDRHWPVVAELEARAMAIGLSASGLTRYDKDLTRIGTPLLAIAAGDRGPESVERAEFTARITRSRRRKVMVKQGAGHMDLVIGTRFRTEIRDEIVTWMDSLSMPPS